MGEKELPDGVEDLLSQREYSGNSKVSRKVESRDKTRVVTYRAPHNSAVQVYDYTSNQSRVLFGPDFMTDIVTVETSDHARLSLQLAYNWHFDVDKTGADEESAVKIFSVPDLVGDACKSIASRVR